MFFEHALSDAGRSSGLQIEALRSALGPGVDPAHDYSKVERRPSPERRVAAPKAPESQAVGGRPPSASIAALKAKLHGGGGVGPESAPSAAQAAAHARPAQVPQRPSSAFLRVARKDMVVASEGPSPGQYRPNIEATMPRANKGPVEFPGTRGPSLVRASSKKALPGEEPDGLALADKAKPHLRSFWIGKTPGRPDLLKGMATTDSHSIDHIEEAFEARSESRRQPAYDFGKLVARGQGGTDPKPAGVSEPGRYDPNENFVKAGPRMAHVRFDQQVARRPISAPAGPDRRTLPAAPNEALSTVRRVPRCDFATLAERKPLVCVAEDLSGQSHEHADIHKADAVQSHRRRPRTADSFSKSTSRAQDLRCKRHFVPQEDLKSSGPKTTDDLPEDFNDRPCLRRKPVNLTDMARSQGRLGGERKHGVPPSRMKRSHSAGTWRRDRRTGEADAHGGQLGFSQLAIAELRATRTYEAMTGEEPDKAGATLAIAYAEEDGGD